MKAQHVADIGGKRFLERDAIDEDYRLEGLACRLCAARRGHDHFVQ